MKNLFILCSADGCAADPEDTGSLPGRTGRNYWGFQVAIPTCLDVAS